MSNVLKMEKQTLIQQLLSLGWSYRRIQEETGIHRTTISKYDSSHPCHVSRTQTSNSKSTKVPAEPDQPADENRPKCPPTSSPNESVQADQTPPHTPENPSQSRESGSDDGSFENATIKKPTRISQAQAYDEIIREKLRHDLTAQRIYQDLVTDYDFPHGYDSIKRYVRKLKKKTPKVFARIHTTPGEEAQVDFGQAAPTLKNSRYVRPWLFKMVLSFSRHSYEEVVWTQDVETFIRCHEHAFEAFGGVPKLLRLDNLKSGVLQAHLYEPELNPLYAAFAKHAGFVPLPCLPRKPEHKGKTESGVGYTKDNALKGLKFESLQAQNAHLRNWNKRWARTRIHGTTKKQVWALFTESEQKALKPLPDKLFQYFKVGSRKVQADGHIEVARAYYSVPHRYLGQTVKVHFNAEWVKVLHGTEVIAFHRKIEAGRFHTDKNHLPTNKCLTTEEYKAKLLIRCAKVGGSCLEWAEQALKARQQMAFRAIQGVLHLQKKYTPEKINWACEQALKMASVRYHTVALLCQDRKETEANKQLDLLQQHEVIRPLQEYQDYLESNIQPKSKEQ